ncbi:hypothetical protein C0J52_17605 [Blattella germanica]|nr:hypothetical protein C0J52_17605 [Blattella germanica]
MTFLNYSDGGTVLIAGQQQQFLFLETIVEETSDDLRSESDRSGPAGWPDSDSDTESVIHVPNSLDCCDPPEWSGSERDLAVPKKRRRRAADAQDVEEHDDAGAEPDAETASLSSRSSSLLQFECLEKHCEDVFRTSATNDPFQDSSPFPPPSPSVMSSFSFDSLESNRWRFSASPDSLDDLPEENSNSESDSTSSDEGASSDDTLQHSSWSSRKAKGISNEANSAGGGGGGKETAVDTKPQRSAENLSEDSGFGDHCIPAGVASSNITTRCNTVGTIVEDEDSCSSYYSDSSAGSSSGGAASSETSEQEKHGDRKPAATATKKKVLKLNREFEFRERRGWDVEEAKFNSSCWQSAPSLLLGEEEKKRRKEERLGSFPVTESVYSRAQDCQHLSSVPDILVLCQGEERLVAQSDALSPVKESADENADKELNTCKMSSRFPILSTPNLIYSSQEEFLKHEQRHSSMTRVPLKSFGGSNSEVDHLVVKEQTSKSLTPLPTSGAAASKGVHFCPVVSEVSWRDSYSDDDDDEDEPQDDRDEDETDEEMEKALVALEKGEDVGMSPKKQMLTLSKIQIGVPVGPGSTERERVVMELSPVTPTSAESHVVVKAADTSNSSTPAVHSVSMEKEKEPSESSRRDSSEGSKKSSKFGGFFQRFSLRRLSGRVGGSSNASSKKQQKEEKKKGKKLEETSAEYEDVTIIPLHPPAEDNKPAPDVVVSSKPPLPPLPPRSIGNANKPTPAPRRRPDAHDSALPAPSVAAVSGLQLQGKQDTTTMSHIDPTTTPPPPGKRAAGRRPPLGLLETDLDTDISTVRPHQNGAAPSSKKARSLLNLGEMSTGCLQQQQPVMLLQPPPGGSTNRPLTPADSRAKSMEFLLDKENQAAVQVGIS